MNHNLNFYNEYEAEIDKENREKALHLFKKMTDAKPGLMQNAKVKIKDDIDGKVFISIDNMSAFETKTKEIILKFLNEMKHKK